MTEKKVADFLRNMDPEAQAALLYTASINNISIERQLVPMIATMLPCVVENLEFLNKEENNERK